MNVLVAVMVVLALFGVDRAAEVIARPLAFLIALMLGFPLRDAASALRGGKDGT